MPSHTPSMLQAQVHLHLGKSNQESVQHAPFLEDQNKALTRTKSTDHRMLKSFSSRGNVT